MVIHFYAATFVLGFWVGFAIAWWRARRPVQIFLRDGETTVKLPRRAKSIQVIAYGGGGSGGYSGQGGKGGIAIVNSGGSGG